VTDERLCGVCRGPLEDEDDGLCFACCLDGWHRADEPAPPSQDDPLPDEG